MGTLYSFGTISVFLLIFATVEDQRLLGASSPIAVTQELPLIANPGPRLLTVGVDGNIWFCESTGKIGRITRAGALTEFAGLSGPAHGITLGRDNNLWFTESTGNLIGFITSNGSISEISLGSGAARGPRGIALNRNGNLYFCESLVGRIGVYNPITHAVAEYTIPTAGPVPGPIDIVASPDGNMWFTESANSSIGKIDSDFNITMYSTGITPSSAPNGIAIGPDGNIWFTELSTNKICRFSLSEPKFSSVDEFPGPLGQFSPLEIVQGPDFQMWFTGLNSPRIASITTMNGTNQFLTEYSCSYDSFGIAVSNQGEVCFTESLLQSSAVGFEGGLTRPRQFAIIPQLTLLPSGNRAFYNSISPSTVAGLKNIQNVIDKYARRHMVSAYTFDKNAQVFVNLQNNQELLEKTSGVFLATSARMDIDISGDPEAMPYTTLIYPGWNFFGIPPLQEGTLPIAVAHDWSNFELFDPTHSAITGPNRTAAIGAGAYDWDGAAYHLVTTLETGKGYWIKNTTAQTLQFTRVNTATGGVVFLSDREAASGSSTGGSAGEAWAPPALPEATADQTRRCGTGGTAALMAGLLALAAGARRRPRRVPASPTA